MKFRGRDQTCFDFLQVKAHWEAENQEYAYFTYTFFFVIWARIELEKS